MHVHERFPNRRSKSNRSQHAGARSAAVIAAPELVEDGVTGFRRDGTDDLVEALGRVGDIDPAACRKRVEDKFSGPAMVKGYEQVFEQLTR